MELNALYRRSFKTRKIAFLKLMFPEILNPMGKGMQVANKIFQLVIIFIEIPLKKFFHTS